ncbi:transporter substrate-binding domain-containing protein [Maricurvus nonylphenolicus]|uniref:substrate-binding periplasmic protein n=1 Tax=Maricurvus nonylphenolicus TaxID=1008307 RepID=UPI0036F273C0
MKVLYVFIFLLASCTAGASTITVLTHNAEDSLFRDEDGETKGIKHSGRRAFTYELAKDMMQRMNLMGEIKNVPLSRGLHLITHKDNYALFHVAWTKKRATKFKWVGPIISNKMYIYKNSSNIVESASLNDLDLNSRFCLVRHSITSEIVAAHGMRNIVKATNYKSCFKMLAAGRVDYTSIADNDFNWLKSKLTPSSLHQIQRTNVMLGETEGFIAFSKNVSDDEIDRWQASLDHIKASGRYQQLVDEFLYGE